MKNTSGIHSLLKAAKVPLFRKHPVYKDIYFADMKACSLFDSIANLMADAFHNGADIYPIGDNNVQVNDQKVAGIADTYPLCRKDRFFQPSSNGFR